MKSRKWYSNSSNVQFNEIFAFFFSCNYCILTNRDYPPIPNWDLQSLFSRKNLPLRSEVRWINFQEPYFVFEYLHCVAKAKNNLPNWIFVLDQISSMPLSKEFFPNLHVRNNKNVVFSMHDDNIQVLENHLNNLDWFLKVETLFEYSQWQKHDAD